jgi:hypothetical protein
MYVCLLEFIILEAVTKMSKYSDFFKIICIIENQYALYTRVEHYPANRLLVKAERMLNHS